MFFITICYFGLNLSAIRLKFVFYFQGKYVMVVTVITMKNRKWILYPYSIFHARMIGGFVHHSFINNPATIYSIS